MSKLWSGRFSEPTDALVDEFNASITFDKRMILHDIESSIVHARMLGRQNIIDANEAKLIEETLRLIADEAAQGKFVFDTADEDVHMAVEKRLIALIGPVGGKLHTARSRNDQVTTTFRLYLRGELETILTAIRALAETIIFKAEENISVLMPGYTHLQTAQPVLFAHYIMAYFQMLRRDYERFNEIRKRMNFSPLGAGALAGTTFPIDRHFTAEELGFSAPTENSMDSVSDRDFAVEILSAASICMMHLSRFSEEIILYSTAEFAFVELSDNFATGSSIMPQKKNPDIPELIRGKTGRVYGSLMALLTTMKGLPLSYNKDMQEDKEGVFDTIDTLTASLKIFTPMLAALRLKTDAMYAAALKGYSTATDMADYLVRKGLPFRQAHHAVGQAVSFAIRESKMLQELSLAELQTFSPLIGADIHDFLTVESSVMNRRSYGGTSPESVRLQIKHAKDFLDAAGE